MYKKKRLFSALDMTRDPVSMVAKWLREPQATRPAEFFIDRATVYDDIWYVQASKYVDSAEEYNALAEAFENRVCEHPINSGKCGLPT